MNYKINKSKKTTEPTASGGDLFYELAIEHSKNQDATAEELFLNWFNLTEISIYASLDSVYMDYANFLIDMYRKGLTLDGISKEYIGKYLDHLKKIYECGLDCDPVEISKLEVYTQYLIDRYKATGDRPKSHLTKEQMDEEERATQEVDKAADHYLYQLAILSTRVPEYPSTQLNDQELFINWFLLNDCYGGSLFKRKEVDGKTLSYNESIYSFYMDFIGEMDRRGVILSPVSEEFINDFLSIQESYYWGTLVPMMRTHWKF